MLGFTRGRECCYGHCYTSSSSLPRPSAATAGNDDAWWAQAVTHALDSADVEDLGSDVKRRLKSVLDAALGKAAKHACRRLLSGRVRVVPNPYKLGHDLADPVM